MLTLESFEKGGRDKRLFLQVVATKISQVRETRFQKHPLQSYYVWLKVVMLRSNWKDSKDGTQIISGDMVALYCSVRFLDSKSGEGYLLTEQHEQHILQGQVKAGADGSVRDKVEAGRTLDGTLWAKLVNGSQVNQHPLPWQDSKWGTVTFQKANPHPCPTPCLSLSLKDMIPTRQPVWGEGRMRSVWHHSVIYISL